MRTREAILHELTTEQVKLAALERELSTVRGRIDPFTRSEARRSYQTRCEAPYNPYPALTAGLSFRLRSVSD